MVRVIWARLFGSINVDELLDLILDLSVAVHGSIGSHARTQSRARLSHGSVRVVHGSVAVWSRSRSVGTHLRARPSPVGRGARLGRDTT